MNMKPVGKRPNSPDRIRRDQRRLLRDFFSHIVHILATSGTATFFSNDDAEFWAEFDALAIQQGRMTAYDLEALKRFFFGGVLDLQGEIILERLHRTVAYNGHSA